MSNALLLASLLLAAANPAPPSAVQEFAALQQQADAARKSGDLKARLRAVLQIRDLFNNAPDALEAAAQAYAEAGDTQQALLALSEFADIGQADDALCNRRKKTFASLENLPQYRSILRRFTANEQPVSLAEPAFTLSDPQLLPEDVDYDAHSKSFLITSVLEKKIVRITLDGRSNEFAASPSHWPMLALKVDASRNRLWATEVALDGFIFVPKSDWGRSAVLCFDLVTGDLKLRIEGPPRASLGDLALSRSGDPIVSDGDGGGLYRVAGKRLERLDGGDFISPQTPAMHPSGAQIFVPDYARGIGLLDLASKRVAWLNRDAKPRFAINGIDGLYFDRGTLIATQNGTSPERVIRFQLNPALTEIVAGQVVERSTPTLGDPTHGVIVGDSFYYIANSGWSALDEHGALKPGAKLTPAHIKRFQLS